MLIYLSFLQTVDDHSKAKELDGFPFCEFIIISYYKYIYIYNYKFKKLQLMQTTVIFRAVMVCIRLR